MNKTIGHVKTTYKVTAGDMDYVLVGAFEGGSNYWIEKVSVVDDDYKGGEYASDVIGLGGELLIHVSDGDTIKLTQAKLLNGFQLYVDGGGKNFPFDLTSPDAITYDMILQYALFGEVIYG